MQVEGKQLALILIPITTYCIMDQSVMDDTLRRERIGALLLQETNYCCPNYMAPDFASTEELRPTPLRIIEECAKLVTDLSLEPPPNFHRIKSPSSVTSTAFVDSTSHSKFPQDMHQTCLMTWRRQMASWAYTAVDTFGLDRELVAVAFDMLDRYLSREIKSDCDFTREDFQLVSMTCLYMVVKTLEPSKKLSIPALIDMSRGYYCAQDITETEMEILQVLQWRINGPTPLAFIQELATVIPSCSNDLMHSCRELCEMAVMDEFFVPYKSSSIAAAVLITAARQHGLSTEIVESPVSLWMQVDKDQVTILCEHFER